MTKETKELIGAISMMAILISIGILIGVIGCTVKWEWFTHREEPTYYPVSYSDDRPDGCIEGKFQVVEHSERDEDTAKISTSYRVQECILSSIEYPIWGQTTNTKNQWFTRKKFDNKTKAIAYMNEYMKIVPDDKVIASSTPSIATTTTAVPCIEHDESSARDCLPFVLLNP